MFPRIPIGTRIGKYDLFIPSPERKWEPYENDEKIKSGVVVSGSFVNDGARAPTWAQALGPTVFSSPLTVSTKKLFYIRQSLSVPNTCDYPQH